MTRGEGVIREAIIALEVCQDSGNDSCAAAGCSGASASLWNDLDGTLFNDEPSQVSRLLFGVLKVFALSPSAYTLQQFRLVSRLCHLCMSMYLLASTTLPAQMNTA